MILAAETETAAASGTGWVQIVVAVIGLAGLALGGYMTYRAKGREVSKSDAQQLIDQYQEGRAEDQARITALETKVTNFDKRDVLFRMYVFSLHKHINDGFPPPPPPWPEGLL